MYKEQQIEEMKTAIMNYADKYDWGLIAFECENLAIVLYNLGYRKIDDDCAVITKDELKLYQRKAVKEFAEKLKENACRGCIDERREEITKNEEYYEADGSKKEI